jgi:hypothetical protein
MAGAEEKQPLIPKRTHAATDIRRGYKVGAGTTITEDVHTHTIQVTDYDAQQTSTMSVLFMLTGTVMTNPVLWTEILVVLVIFVIPASTLVLMKEKHLDHMVETDGAQLQSFTSLMSGLAAFLLGFYTSLSVGRWWRLRTSGVGNIWSGASQLQLLVSQMATRDAQILSALRRYARASLAIVFIKRSQGAENLKANLTQLSEWGILTEEEVEKLQAYSNNLAESIWTWNVNIVTQLYKKGLIKSDQQYTLILEKALIGRSGAAVIGSQLGTPIPFMYAHLLGFLVKMHNIMLALVMSSFAAYAWKKGEYVPCFQIAGRVFLLPFFYNALLLINEDLADPFAGDTTDFPMSKYESGIEGDGKSYVEAGDHLPDWLAKEFANKKIEGV